MSVRIAAASLAILATSASMVPLETARAAPLGATEYELVMTRNPDLAKGAELYADCAMCHGAHGEGAAEGSIPALAGQPYTVIARQIVAFRVGLRRDALMAHFTNRQHLSFSQPIADVSAYISRLTVTASAKPAPAEDSAVGAMAYAKSCERCHGALGEGNSDTITPRLASQYSQYLLRQLTEAAEGRRIPMSEAHAQISPMPGHETLVAISRYLESIER